jgi:hypothetical protein
MTQSYITIKAGSYRNQEIVDTVFPLVKQFQMGANGGFVTVDGSALFGPDKTKIRVKVAGPAAYSFTDENAFVATGGTPAAEVAQATSETDEEIMERIGERFGILTEMTKAACAGDIRAMIVTGPPGVGKSFGVEKELEKASLFDKISGRKIRSEVVKGAATAIGLYQLLYQYSDKDCVLVFDDCDSLFFDDLSLNLLKAALDSGKRRRINWNSESSVLNREGIPNSFDFKGSIVFITNLKFDNIKSKKLQDHLEALQSRCHYLDLTLNTVRDKLLRIKQIAKEGALFDGYDFDQAKEDSIIDFMHTNKNRLREISLRMALKIADLAKMAPTRWEHLAMTTCAKPL